MTAKTRAQLDAEIAEALARPSRASGSRRRAAPTRDRGDALSTAAGIVTDRVRASDAYRLGRDEVVRAVVAAVGPSPTVARLKELGGLTEIVRAQIERASMTGLDDNLGSPMFPLTPRSLLAREAGDLRTRVQQRLSPKSSHSKIANVRDDDGSFYLTENSPTSAPLGPEFRSRLAAKRAAMRLVREGKHRGVEVWHRWRGARYMQGLAREDGWSDV